MPVSVQPMPTPPSLRVPNPSSAAPAPFPGGEVVEGAFGRWSVGQKVLGSGSFAVVKEAVNLATGWQAVVKVVNVSEDNKKSSNHALYCWRELATLAHLGMGNHPNIVKLYDAGIDGDTVYLFEERVEGVELFEFLRQHDGKLPADQVRHIAAQILSALRYMHRHHVLHRDIKLDNVIVCPRTLHCTVIDFNLSTFFQEGSPLAEPVGCINYSSPQILAAARGEAYMPEKGWSDLWALGVAVYGLLVGFFPFKSEQARRLVREHALLSTKPLPWHAPVADADARSFVELVLNPASLGAISAESLCQHPFVAGDPALLVDPDATPSAGRPLDHLVESNDALVAEDPDEQRGAARALVHEIADFVRRKIAEAGGAAPGSRPGTPAASAAARTPSASTVATSSTSASASSASTVVAAPPVEVRRVMEPPRVGSGRKGAAGTGEGVEQYGKRSILRRFFGIGK